MNDLVKIVVGVLLMSTQCHSQDSVSSHLSYFSNPINIELFASSNPYNSSYIAKQPPCVNNLNILDTHHNTIELGYFTSQRNQMEAQGHPVYTCLKKSHDSVYLKPRCPWVGAHDMSGSKWNETIGYQFNETLPDGNYLVWNGLGRLLEHRAVKNNMQSGLMFHSFQTNEYSATIDLFEAGEVVQTASIIKGMINGKQIASDSLTQFEKEVNAYYLALLNVHYFEYFKMQECMTPIHINHFLAKSTNFHEYILAFCQRELNYVPWENNDVEKVIIQFKIHKLGDPEAGQFYDYTVLQGKTKSMIHRCIEALQNYSNSDVACADLEDVTVEATFMFPN